MASTVLKAAFLIGSGFATALFYTRIRKVQENNRCTTSNRTTAEAETAIADLTRNERRFLQFASVEYGWQIYMTPQDFLQSVLERYPLPCLRRRILTDNEVSQFQAAVSPVSQSNVNFFRNASDKGIISFMDYLFLISVLTRPESGFRLAFNMFDIDGNHRINRKEFLVARKLLGNSIRQRKVNVDARKTLTQLEYSTAMTTLQVHFFGIEGSGSLSYEEFHHFVKNLQTEILQIEFGRYSQNGVSITDENFARILLRYTHLEPHHYETIIGRLSSLENHHEVSYEEFEQFCKVLRNMKDFVLAMRVFHSLNGSISRDEFSRAVTICSDSVMKIEHLIDIVFAMFDENGDGRMSYDKFLLVIKNHFQFLNDRRLVGWKAFKRCCRREIRRT
ncbi:calcium uptake protein 3, mitochondrial-like [Sabethes cyaneus]|uniref:calcium uptake protein 3, mitochondrial-like n=1 Tax=Sabethes cyaneus TaxID=53552 RepID=UPI00237ED3B8|nr:calcium uptake protein 3, mitochondrial-like [Sabethes cyaneus]